MFKRFLPPTLLLLIMASCAAPNSSADDTATLPSTTTGPAAVDLSTPSKALQSLAAAMDASNVNAAQSCVVPDPVQQGAVEQLVSIMDTLKNFRAAAIAQFPTDSAGEIAQMPEFSLSRQLVGGVKEDVNGNNAMVTPLGKGDAKPVAALKINGHWKVDFSGTDDGKQMIAQAASLAASLKPIDDVTAGMLAGKYKTWKDVQDAMNAAANVANPAPSTGPSAVDLSTPTKTVQSLAAAMDSASVDSAKQCVLDNPEQQKVIEQMVAGVATLKNFKIAASSKFPADSADVVNDMPSPNFTNDLAGGVDEKIDPASNTATVTRSAANLSDFQPLGLKKVGDTWKIDLAASDNGKTAMVAIPAAAPRMKILQDVTTNLIAGNYKNWDEVKTALQKAVAATEP